MTDMTNTSSERMMTPELMYIFGLHAVLCKDGGGSAARFGKDKRRIGSFAARFYTAQNTEKGSLSEA